MVVSWCGLPIWQNWEFEVLFSFLLAEESNKSCLGPFPTGTGLSDDGLTPILLTGRVVLSVLGEQRYFEVMK